MSDGSNFRGRLVLGTIVTFVGDPRRWQVRAVPSDRYVILTVPDNQSRNNLYTIIDWERDVRGPDDIVGGHGYNTVAQIDQSAAALAAGDIGVSERPSRYVPLRIQAVGA